MDSNGFPIPFDSFRMHGCNYVQRKFTRSDGSPERLALLVCSGIRTIIDVADHHGYVSPRSRPSVEGFIRPREMAYKGSTQAYKPGKLE